MLLRAKVTYVKVVAWISLVFFLSCAIGALASKQADAAPWFLLFVPVGLYMLLFSGPVEMDYEKIRYNTPWAHYEILWREVSRIEIDAQGGNIAFIGEGKQLCAIGPGFWSGEDKVQMLMMLESQTKKGGIRVDETPKAMFKLSKNTKVKRHSDAT